MSSTIDGSSISYSGRPGCAPVHCTTTSPGGTRIVMPCVISTPSRSHSGRASHQRAAGPGDRGDAAELAWPVDDRHVVAAGGGDAGGLQPGDPAADHDDRTRCFAAGAYQSGSSVSRPARRLADAGDDRVARVAHLARLVAADARPDPVGLAGAQLGDEVGVGDLGAGHLDGVAHVVRRAPTRPGPSRRPSPAGTPGRRPAPPAHVRHTSMLKPGGSWKSGRVFSAEKIEPRTTTR